MTPERIRIKADAYRQAWLAKFGILPNDHNTSLGLAVAIHETDAGDDWPGEHNWGACTDRGLHDDERAAIAGIIPSPETLGRAITALNEAGLRTAGLHADSAPNVGWYFVYFAVFPNDEKGAEYFVHVLAEQRPACRKVLEADADAPCFDAYALAYEMYASSYYTGFHNPHQPGGAQKNVDDYESAITKLLPWIRSALAMSA